MRVQFPEKLAPTATVKTDGMDDYEWFDAHPGLILLLCGCWWCDQTGDLRAQPSCKGHMRDVERFNARSIS